MAYLGEIRLFAFGFTPTSSGPAWWPCDGSLLSIAQNPALFSLIGYTYGGDEKNFALPNLRGLVALGAGAGPGLTPRQVGDTGGNASVQLLIPQIAVHNHTLNASTAKATSLSAKGNVLAQPSQGGFDQPQTLGRIYSSRAAGASLAPQSILEAGGNGSHNNMQPYVVLNYCICLAGIKPVKSPEAAEGQLAGAQP